MRKAHLRKIVDSRVTAAAEITLRGLHNEPVDFNLSSDMCKKQRGSDDDFCLPDFPSEITFRSSDHAKVDLHVVTDIVKKNIARWCCGVELVLQRLRRLYDAVRCIRRFVLKSNAIRREQLDAMYRWWVEAESKQRQRTYSAIKSWKGKQHQGTHCPKLVARYVDCFVTEDVKQLTVYAAYDACRLLFYDQMREHKSKKVMLQKRLAELQQRRISEELREECLPYHLRTGSGKTLAMQIDDADKEIARCQSQEPVFHFRPGDLPLERLVHMSKQQGHQRPGAVTLKSQGKRRGTLVQPCFRNWGMAADHVNFEDDLDKVAEQVGALVAEGDEDTDPEREPEAETEGAAPGLLVTVAGEPGPDASIGRADLPGAVSSGADHGQFLSGWWFGSSSPTTETHETAHAPHHLQSGSANAVWDRAVPRGRSGSQALVPPKAARRSRSMDTGSMSSLRRTSKFNIRSRSLEPHSLASSCLPATSAPSRKAQACASNASPARRACSLEEKHLDNGRSCAAARSRSWDPSQPVRFPSHTIGKSSASPKPRPLGTLPAGDGRTQTLDVVSLQPDPAADRPRTRELQPLTPRTGFLQTRPSVQISLADPQVMPEAREKASVDVASPTGNRSRAPSLSRGALSPTSRSRVQTSPRSSGSSPGGGKYPRSHALGGPRKALGRPSIDVPQVVDKPPLQTGSILDDSVSPELRRPVSENGWRPSDRPPTQPLSPVSPELSPDRPGSPKSLPRQLPPVAVLSRVPAIGIQDVLPSPNGPRSADGVLLPLTPRPGTPSSLALRSPELAPLQLENHDIVHPDGTGGASEHDSQDATLQPRRFTPRWSRSPSLSPGRSPAVSPSGQSQTRTSRSPSIFESKRMMPGPLTFVDISRSDEPSPLPNGQSAITNGKDTPAVFEPSRRSSASVSPGVQRRPSSPLASLGSLQGPSVSPRVQSSPLGAMGSPQGSSNSRITGPSSKYLISGSPTGPKPALHPKQSVDITRVPTISLSPSRSAPPDSVSPDISLTVGSLASPSLQARGSEPEKQENRASLT